MPLALWPAHRSTEDELFTGFRQFLLSAWTRGARQSFTSGFKIAPPKDGSHLRARLRIYIVVKPFRSFVSVVAVCLTLGLCACTSSSESASQREKDANSAAGKVGKAAHSVAKETGKVAAAAGRKLGKAAHQAHEGWKQAEQEERAKKK